MARATPAGPAAATRVGGTTIAPAASVVLVTAIATAIPLALVLGVVRDGPGPGPRTVAMARGALVGEVATGSARTADPGEVQPAAGVPDLPWLADRGDGVWLYGRGARARALPPGEYGLAIDGRYVATSTPGAAGRSTIHLRTTATGAPVRDIDAPIWVSAAAWTARGLVATGYRDAAMRQDGGLILVSPTGSTDVLVPAGPFSTALGLPVARGDVVVSASGQVVASNVCGVKLCDSQVVDLASGATFRPAHATEGFLRAVTDDAVLTTDHDARWISARRFVDGRETWRLTDTVLLDPVAGAGGSLIGVVGSTATGWGVDRIDPAGRAQRLTPRVGVDAPWPRVWAQLSTPAVVAIGRTSFGEAVATVGSVDMELVRTESPQPTIARAMFALSVEPETTR